MSEIKLSAEQYESWDGSPEDLAAILERPELAHAALADEPLRDAEGGYLIPVVRGDRDAVSAAAATLGRKGGRAGRGESKRRAHATPEHMRAIRAQGHVSLTNDFHGSRVRVRPDAAGWLSAGQITRARRALCGVRDCTCGGPLGERGRQDATVEDHGFARDGSRRIRVVLRCPKCSTPAVPATRVPAWTCPRCGCVFRPRR